MTDISYIGEHLLPGQIGHLLVVTAFVSALLSSFAFFRNVSGQNHEDWYGLGRWSYYVHGASVLGVIGLIFYMMLNKYYEYHYVWSHVSDDLPFRYIFSAFWEGQEGSFLLWMFWHVIIGFFLLRKRTKWTAGVMGTVSAIQFFLSSMILGVYVLGHKFGSSPFVLIRDVMDIPLFANAQYLDLIEGTGLNPLLQNYWNTIHPPTTFLGFASLTVPYAFAISGLLAEDKTGWYKAVLPWGLFSGALLGTGILMGAAWAYEALSFGGYWAWDPVENSSLAPWLIMIAGIHTNLISRNTGRSKVMTFFFYLLAFVLIVYSTFLTRSGVLGDTSVHAFTEMGLEWQLIIFLAFFTILGIWLLIKNWSNLVHKGEEEPLESREFWMFIGSLVLLFSSVLILFTTSIPVYNKLFDAFGTLIGQDLSHFHRTSPLDPVEHYNRYQMWIAIFIGILSSFAIFLRYAGKNWSTQKRDFLMRTTIHLAISGVLSYLLSFWININSWSYWLLLFTALMAIVSNLDYLVSFVRLNMKKSAATLSHIGFGLLILGAMASGLNKQYISSNPFAQRGLIGTMDEDRLSKNITLIKGAPMFMNDYWVTYVSDTMVGNLRKYLIHYRKTDSLGNKTEEFVLRPQVVYNNKVTKVASVNPATKHYLHKDIFTHITSIPPQLMDIEMAHNIEDSLNYVSLDKAIGDTFRLNDNIFGVLESIIESPEHEEYIPEEYDIAFGVKFVFRDTVLKQSWEATPIAVLRGNLIYKFAEQIDPLKLRIELQDEIFNSEHYAKDLEFIPMVTKLRDSFKLADYMFYLDGFSEEIRHPGYGAMEGDIAISGQVRVVTPLGEERLLSPVFVIRDSRQFSLDAFDALSGIHARLSKIDPETGNITLEIALGNSVKNMSIPFEYADNVPRTDYIVLEAIEFPGINLVWLGSCMMLLGLFIGIADRRKKE